jgi:integrase
VKPDLGDRQLNTLLRGDIEAWGARLTVAPRTARQIVQYVSTMLDAAVADGLLVVNPARGAVRPRVDAAPVVPFGDSEVDALRAAAPDWFAVALDLGLGAGLRQSEASGLTVDRCRLPATSFDRRPAARVAPVWRADVRAAEVEAVLPDGAPRRRGRRSARPSRRSVRHRDPRIGPACTGGAPTRRQRFGETWRKLRTTAALPKARFHDTRHTFASVLLAGGVSVPACAEYLGHSPAELLRTYAHLVPKDHDRARATLQAAFHLACPVRVPGGRRRGRIRR